MKSYLLIELWTSEKMEFDSGILEMGDAKEGLNVLSNHPDHTLNMRKRRSNLNSFL